MLGHVTALNALAVVTNYGDLDSEIVLALLPTPANVGEMLWLSSLGGQIERSNVVEVGGRRGLPVEFESIFCSEHTEHDIMFHDIEVPCNDGPFICVLDENFVDLQYIYYNFCKFSPTFDVIDVNAIN